MPDHQGPDGAYPGWPSGQITGADVAPECPDCGEKIPAHSCWEGDPTPEDLAWLAGVVLAVHQQNSHGAVVLQTGTIEDGGR